ncbi:MAG TPA: hypothetical protein VNZ52_15715, partial [Candidatus Thermoplasmatota archaeon]|nr:hypothetical protein [Candidatus Thermoplasmatota archaeon]
PGPFPSPLPPPGGSPEVPLVLTRPRSGLRWALLVPPYGGINAQGHPGLYTLHQAMLRRAGFGVALVTMPYHGLRAMKGFPSGWGFVRADLGATSRALASAAADVTAMTRYLREQEGATTVVGLGISLGGAALGLAMAQGAPVDAGAFLAAVDNPASFYATGQNREARRRTLAAAGVTNGMVAEAFRPFSPSTYPAPVPGNRLFYAIPPHDLVVPASWQRAWRERWDGREVPAALHAHASAIASPGIAQRLSRDLAAAVSTGR